MQSFYRSGGTGSVPADPFATSNIRSKGSTSLYVMASAKTATAGLPVDHESSFIYRGVVGWQQPWLVGALAPLATPGRHIFYAGLKGRALDYAPVQQAWASITDAHLQAYRDSVPHQWGADAAVDDAVGLIRDVRGNITAALVEVRRVLT